MDDKIYGLHFVWLRLRLVTSVVRSCWFTYWFTYFFTCARGTFTSPRKTFRFTCKGRTCVATLRNVNVSSGMRKKCCVDWLPLAEQSMVVGWVDSFQPELGFTHMPQSMEQSSHFLRKIPIRWWKCNTVASVYCKNMIYVYWCFQQIIKSY